MTRVKSLPVVDQVEQQGFAVVPNVLAPGTLDVILQDLSQAPPRRGRAGLRHLMRYPAVRGLAQSPELLGIAHEILGGEAFPFRATLFVKNPDANWLVAWHQDTALPLTEKREVLPGWGPWSMKDGIHYAHAPASALEQVLAIRLHLDDCTESNGPLRVLAGTHQLGVMSDDQVAALAVERPAVACTVNAGGAVLMRPLLVHASSKSAVNLPRRVLHIEYAATQVFADGTRLAIA